MNPFFRLGSSQSFMVRNIVDFLANIDEQHNIDRLKYISNDQDRK